MNMEVTKRVDFSCCYLQDQELQIHNCRLEVTVVGPQRFHDFGRVISYEELTRYIKNVVPKSAFLYRLNDTVSQSISDALYEAGCETRGYDFEISAENLCAHFASVLQNNLNMNEPGVKIIDMKLREDNNSYVSWRPGD